MPARVRKPQSAMSRGSAGNVTDAEAEAAERRSFQHDVESDRRRAAPLGSHLTCGMTKATSTTPRRAGERSTGTAAQRVGQITRRQASAFARVAAATMFEVEVPCSGRTRAADRLPSAQRRKRP